MDQAQHTGPDERHTPSYRMQLNLRVAYCNARDGAWPYRFLGKALRAAEELGDDVDISQLFARIGMVDKTFREATGYKGKIPDLMGEAEPVDGALQLTA